MQETENFDMDLVNCRIGSLEISMTGTISSFFVNCRIGSLEIIDWAIDAAEEVNCRIGSLENYPNRFMR